MRLRGNVTSYQMSQFKPYLGEALMFWRRKKQEYNGAEAARYAKKYLRKVRAYDWKVEYIDPKTGEKWLMDFTEGAAQGGGCPRLRKME
jgi:hypothetical protein